MGSYFGKEIHISIFGQSHAECIGVTIDGLPAGEAVDEEALRAFMLRRAPGRSAESTARREADEPHIICGLHNGRTCGAPLTAIIKNGDTRSKDYDKLRDLPRPGHADLTAEIKYRGFQDGRGGGHFSGRLTAPLCVAGGICAQILARRGIEIGAHILSIEGINDRRFNALGETKETLDRVKSAPFPVLDEAAGERMRGAILAAKAEGDSVGGVVECIVTGLPAGVGSPMFGGLESMLSAAIFAMPAVKGVEFGSGFGAALMRGSEHNDEITLDGGEIRRRNSDAHEQRGRHTRRHKRRNAGNLPRSLQAHAIDTEAAAHRLALGDEGRRAADNRTPRPVRGAEGRSGGRSRGGDGDARRAA